MPPGFEPLPFGNSSAESQRDSVPKPRVASRELPWEKRVVSANPNGVVARWRSGDTTPLGLRIARTLTQGSLADSATLGWRTQSLWDCRTTGLSVVPYGNGRAGNIRKETCATGLRCGGRMVSKVSDMVIPSRVSGSTRSAPGRGRTGRRSTVAAAGAVS